MELRFKYDALITLKLGRWAEVLSNRIDFIDYWYNLFLSESKIYIDEPDKGNLASFWINRWKNDFEIYVDQYKPKEGEGYCETERHYFAMYSQYLVYEFQTPSKNIAQLYGKPMFEWIMKHYNRFHCFGSNLFIEYFVNEWGLPTGVEQPYRIVNC